MSKPSCPRSASAGSRVGSNSGFMFIRLKPRSERQASADQIIQRLAAATGGNSRDQEFICRTLAARSVWRPKVPRPSSSLSCRVPTAPSSTHSASTFEEQLRGLAAAAGCCLRPRNQESTTESDHRSRPRRGARHHQPNRLKARSIRHSVRVKSRPSTPPTTSIRSSWSWNLVIRPIRRP